ncbi:MAG: ABC transporter substrate-binding protein [Chloroflexi bacterium]|nr:ABC transporter substrate-binding protein [Chloroflexota bacterium]
MSCKTLALLSLTALLLIACGEEATPASDADPAGTAAAASDEPAQADTGQEPFVIGALDSLTGVGESYGIPFSQSKLIAVEEINAAGGINGRPLKLIVEDSKCTSADAITAYKRLTDVEGIKIILGATCSGATLGVAPLAEQDGVVLFSASSTSPDISDAGDYIFRTAINSLKVGADIGNTMWADENRTVGTITEATDYAEGARRSAVTQFEKLGGVVVAAESYPTDAIDFRTQLTKLLNADPDAVLVAVQGEVSGGTIIKQVRELGYEGPIYSEVVPTGSNALDIAGEAATGLKAVVPNPDLETDIGRDFLASFNARYGVAPWPWFQGSAYDGVYIAAECLRQTNDDQDAAGFRDCLYSLTWSGAIGDGYRFDANGDVVGVSHVVIEVLPVAERTEENLGYRVLGAPAAP